MTVNVDDLDTAGLDIDRNDVMSGGFLFEADLDGEGFVISRGVIEAATGGEVVLLGKSVSNERLIVAKFGRVDLAAGSEAVLTFDHAGLIGVEVTKEVLEN